jgi:hypothetical protein
MWVMFPITAQVIYQIIQIMCVVRHFTSKTKGGGLQSVRLWRVFRMLQKYRIMTLSDGILSLSMSTPQLRRIIYWVHFRTIWRHRIHLKLKIPPTTEEAPNRRSDKGWCLWRRRRCSNTCRKEFTSGCNTLRKRKLIQCILTLISQT